MTGGSAKNAVIFAGDAGSLCILFARGAFLQLGSEAPACDSMEATPKSMTVEERMTLLCHPLSFTELLYLLRLQAAIPDDFPRQQLHEVSSSRPSSRGTASMYDSDRARDAAGFV